MAEAVENDHGSDASSAAASTSSRGDESLNSDDFRWTPEAWDRIRRSQKLLDEPQSAEEPLYPSLHLDPGGGEFRLLAILPAPDFGAVVECRLVIHKFVQPPEYEALSYTWGERSKTDNIFINRHRFAVTANAFDAVRAIRKRDSSRLCWIDAICINQHDLQERNHQVTMMASIYKAACCVLVWLGQAIPPTWPLSGPVWPVDWADHVFTKEEQQGAICHLLKSSSTKWWTRRWVVQEISFARSVKVLFGPVEATWEGFLDLAGSINGHYVADQIGRGLGTQLREAVERLNELRCEETRQSSHLGNILFWTKDFDSTEERDQIFSVLSLASMEESKHLIVDYSLPLDQIFAQATFAIIKANQDYRILALVSDRGSSESNQTNNTLPSWVVDYSVLKQWQAKERPDDLNKYLVAQEGHGDSVSDQPCSKVEGIASEKLDSSPVSVQRRIKRMLSTLAEVWRAGSVHNSSKPRELVARARIVGKVLAIASPLPSPGSSHWSTQATEDYQCCSEVRRKFWPSDFIRDATICVGDKTLEWLGEATEAIQNFLRLSPCLACFPRAQRHWELSVIEFDRLERILHVDGADELLRIRQLAFQSISGDWTSWNAYARYACKDASRATLISIAPCEIRDNDTVSLGLANSKARPDDIVARLPGPVLAIFRPCTGNGAWKFVSLAYVPKLAPRLMKTKLETVHIV